MCGIFGFYSQNEISDNYIDKLKEVTLKLSHRGPDSHGFYISKDKKIFLGHTRLSVIDLDKRNNQPFIVNVFSIAISKSLTSCKVSAW